MTRNMKAMAVAIALTAVLLSLVINQGSAASAAEPSRQETSSMWLAKFTWKKLATRPKCAKMGKTYDFSLQSRPNTGFLTAESKLRLRVKKPNGKVVVRKYPLMFGDGDLYWMAHTYPREKVLRARVIASGTGVMPKKKVKVYCGIIVP